MARAEAYAKMRSTSWCNRLITREGKHIAEMFSSRAVPVHDSFFDLTLPHTFKMQKFKIGFKAIISI